MSEHIFDKTKWRSMTIFEQMGNIGSEVSRALRAKAKGDQKSMNGAFYRGLDLIDASVEGLLIQKSPRVKELLRSREEFAKAITTNTPDPTLENYFMQFAIAARLRQGL